MASNQYQNIWSNYWHSNDPLKYITLLNNLVLVMLLIRELRFTQKLTHHLFYL